MALRCSGVQISQLNVRTNGDIEIRFLDEEELKVWVEAQHDLQINGVHIAVGRKSSRPRSTWNATSYIFLFQEMMNSLM